MDNSKNSNTNIKILNIRKKFYKNRNKTRKKVNIKNLIKLKLNKKLLLIIIIWTKIKP